MSEDVSLREVERKVFKSTFQDGLLDILIGWYLLLFVIAIPLSRYWGDFWSSAAIVPFWLMAFLAVNMIKRQVIRPRLGRVKFGAWRKARLKRFNVVAFVILLFALLLGALSFVEFDRLPGWIHMSRFSLVVLLVSGLAAYFLDIGRLYAYGVLTAAAPLAGEFLYVYLGVAHHGFPVTFGFVGGVMITTGVVLLLRFLRQYPLPAVEPDAKGNAR